jgi:DNA-directed RNA polymerase specialized sigma24 family protein
MGLTKQDLQDYRWLLESIETLECEIQYLRDKLDIKSPIWSDMPGCKSEGDKMATAVAQIVDTRDKLFEEVRKAMEKRRKIEAAIEILPEREKVLIRQRYIDGKAWEQICTSMNYELRQVHNIHGSALKLIR